MRCARWWRTGTKTAAWPRSAPRWRCCPASVSAHDRGLPGAVAMIDPGRLKTRLLICRRRSKADDGQGGVTRDYDDVATVWAAVIAAAGRARRREPMPTAPPCGGASCCAGIGADAAASPGRRRKNLSHRLDPRDRDGRIVEIDGAARGLISASACVRGDNAVSLFEGDSMSSAYVALRAAMHDALTADSALARHSAARTSMTCRRAMRRFLTSRSARRASPMRRATAATDAGAPADAACVVAAGRPQGGAYHRRRAAAALDDAPLAPAGHRLVNLRFALADIRREADGRTYHALVRFRAVTEPGTEGEPHGRAKRQGSAAEDRRRHDLRHRRGIAQPQDRIQCRDW